MIKGFLKELFIRAVHGLSRTRLGLYAYQQIVDVAMGREKEVSRYAHKMRFSVPNRLTDYRVRSFHTKEPETLDWIDSMSEGAVLWDVGANVGLYSVYAAKARLCEVYAFEPSVFNLELLARNVFLNNLQQRITIVPIPLSDSLGPNLFQMSTITWGGALSTFGEGFDQSGRPLKNHFEYKTLGMSMNEAVKLLRIPVPRYIKIDVDGLEHFILRGGSGVLREVDSLLIEINDDFSAQAEQSFHSLDDAGLSLYRKCDLGAGNMFNQWWVRDPDSSR